MSGFLPGETPPVELCPYCGNECEADFCDVGVGHVQCGPYHCMECRASQIGPNDEDRELTQAEQDTGWYAPDSEPGSSANVISGQIVDHQHMRRVYESAFTDNPAYRKPGEVESWWESVRKDADWAYQSECLDMDIVTPVDIPVKD